MAWNEARSRRRIQQHLQTVPEFDDQLTLARRGRLLVEAKRRGLMGEMSSRRAFVVEGGHLYGQLLDFDSLVADSNGNETVASHREVLRFLSMHYRLWDAVVDNDEADRVDYHGARMHAIIDAPDNDARGQVQRAVALAAKLGAVSKRVAAAYGFGGRIRFGIDQGRCVAMTTGRAHEKDTLFLGTPANHAAKVAAAAMDEGIFLTPFAESLVGPSALRRTHRGTFVLGAEFIDEATSRFPFDDVDRAGDRLIAEARHDQEFQFHRMEPPLSALKFRDLAPSNSIRMGMASIFADIDGFTSYVDGAIARGNEAIKKAATSIHVIREELNQVLRDDFDGKRVRFIGDCIQGVVAEGGRNQDDGPGTIKQAALCASGMKSSFDLCKEMLTNIDELDLAIGIEYGQVPLSRIGQRGDESVRCATGRAVIVSERIQQEIVGGGVDLGPEACQIADRPTRKSYAAAASIPTYDSAVDLLGTLASPAIQIVRSNPEARPYLDDEAP